MTPIDQDKSLDQSLLIDRKMLEASNEKLHPFI